MRGTPGCPAAGGRASKWAMPVRAEYRVVQYVRVRVCVRLYLAGSLSVIQPVSHQSIRQGLHEAR